MERLVREELERWDSETSVQNSSSGGRGQSPSSSSARGGNRRPQSRPSSGGPSVSTSD